MPRKRKAVEETAEEINQEIQPAAKITKVQEKTVETAKPVKEEIKEEVDNSEDASKPVWCLKRAQAQEATRLCPYLDTIDRGVLDFDFEKLCSVSLSHINVYACMVCGKYFQGRGTSTHAYTHALDTDHHLFLNLATLKFYCLPDNYEVIDPSLDDIKYVLKPTYAEDYIKKIDHNSKMCRAFDGTAYYSGFVGLNNIKANDYMNVILQALSHVPPLREYFLREENYAHLKRPPGDKMALLPQRFGDAHDYMLWFLNTLHIALNGTGKTSSSIIYRIFRGRMRQFTRKVLPVDATEEARRTLMETDEFSEKMNEIPFLSLAMDLPPPPLYLDEQLNSIIPQVPLAVLFAKFNGQSEKEYKTYNANFIKRFELIHLPEYLLITYNRFKKNQWFLEKNPTIVNFPISNVDLYDCLADDAKAIHKYTTYDLISNVIHDGKPVTNQKGDRDLSVVDNGSYRVQTLHQGTGKWFELEDLHVKEILPQMITLAESYIQIWRLNRKKTRVERMGEDGESSVVNGPSNSDNANNLMASAPKAK